MRIAVVGSGPSAFYTVKYFLKMFRDKAVKIDMFERLPEPYGLVRFGVAPDHQEVKNVTNDFANLLKTHPNISLHCGVQVESTPEGFAAFQRDYDGVLIATGAQSAKLVDFPSPPKHHISARDFVLWYNGHPDKLDLHLPEAPREVAIFGMGNVALDVARILCRPCALPNPRAAAWLAARPPGLVRVQGRRGFLEAAFTNRELRELLHLPDISLRVLGLGDLEIPTDRAKRRGWEIIQEMRNMESVKSGNVISLEFNQQPEPAELSISSIGFRVTPGFGLEIGKHGGYVHSGGLAGPGVFLAGWAKRGPRGTIAANIPCAAETAQTMIDFYN